MRLIQQTLIRAGTEDLMNNNVPFKEALRFTGRFKNGILQKEKLFISPLIKTDFAGKWQNANHKEYNLRVKLSVSPGLSFYPDMVNGLFTLTENGKEHKSTFTGESEFSVIRGYMHYCEERLDYSLAIIGEDSLQLFFQPRKAINIPRIWILSRKE